MSKRRRGTNKPKARQQKNERFLSKKVWNDAFKVESPYFDDIACELDDLDFNLVFKNSMGGSSYHTRWKRFTGGCEVIDIWFTKKLMTVGLRGQRAKKKLLPSEVVSYVKSIINQS